MNIPPRTASITELRQNATRLLHEVEETREPVFILQNSKKAGVLLDEKTFEKLLKSHMQRRDGEFEEIQDEKTEHYFGKGKGIFGDGLKFQKKSRAEWK
ncbi:type II toxin-antitoxin system Phd/YefM family antitoxin [Candidatus Peregrinibacteria bacterium]|nr:type II toxin-antitoxin system Phd/YefM family antitoxin [Candidatus Peregrinibacteria bacterium]